MDTRTTITLLVLLLGFLARAGLAQEVAKPAPEPRLRMTVRADAEAVTPGSRFTLALSCKVDAGWHTYWPGLNDTGAPATIRLGLPAGWAAQPALWPAPTRSVAEGDLLDHVLEGEFAVLYDVQVPADAPADGSYTLKVDAEWLVCKSVCVMETTSGSLPMRVETKRRENAPGVQLVKEARSRLPVNTLPPELRTTVRDNVLEITWKGATELTFAPVLNDISYPHLATEGEAKGESLRLNLSAPSPLSTPSPRVEGVITVHFGKDGPARSFWLSIPLAPPPDTKSPK